MTRHGYRRTKYDHDVHPRKGEGLVEQGMIDIEIARGLGISRTRYYEWKKLHSDFSDAVRRGKEQPDAEVARAFKRNCIGYEYKETKVVAVLDKNGKPKGRQVVTRIRKHHPGAVVGQMFWLRVRQPQEWNPAIALSDTGPNRVPASGKLPEQMLREIAEGRAVHHDGEVIPRSLGFNHHYGLRVS